MSSERRVLVSKHAIRKSARDKKKETLFDMFALIEGKVK
jgi:hypothetical protein